MYRDSLEFARNCAECAVVRGSGWPQRPPLHPSSQSPLSDPWSRHYGATSRQEWESVRYCLPGLFEQVALCLCSTGPEGHSFCPSPDQREWDQFLPGVQWAYRNTPTTPPWRSHRSCCLGLIFIPQQKLPCCLLVTSKEPTCRTTVKSLYCPSLLPVSML